MPSASLLGAMMRMLHAPQPGRRAVHVIKPSTLVGTNHEATFHLYDARHNGEAYVVGETVACKRCGTALTAQVRAPTLACTADGCKCVNIVSRQRPAVEDPVAPSRKRRKVKEYVDHMTAAEIRVLAALLRGEYPASRCDGSEPDTVRSYVRDMAAGLSIETFVSLLNKSKDTVRDRAVARPGANHSAGGASGGGRSVVF